MLKGHLTRESFLESSNNLTHLLGTLMHELQPKVTNSSIEPQLEVFCANLRLGSENRVATAHIRHNRVHSSSFVLQCHTVRFTRVPTVSVVGASRQKATEDTVLGVKYGEMLIDNHLQSVCRQVVG